VSTCRIVDLGHCHCLRPRNKTVWLGVVRLRATDLPFTVTRLRFNTAARRGVHTMSCTIISRFSVSGRLYLSMKNTANPYINPLASRSNAPPGRGPGSCSPCIALLLSCWLQSSLSSLASSPTSSPTSTPVTAWHNIWPAACQIAT
jgi:hypothetical protein